MKIFQTTVYGPLALVASLGLASFVFAIGGKLLGSSDPGDLTSASQDQD